MLSIWILAHRTGIFGFACLGIWGLANYIYLRFDIKKWRQQRRPHKWSVDMAAKTGTGGVKKAEH